MTEQSTLEAPEAQSPLEKKSVSAAKILQQVVLIQVHTHIWSASQALKNNDLPHVQASDLPPSYLASLGSKKLIDVNELKIFNTLKRRATRELETYGVEFMGGYAIPCTKIETVALKLKSIEDEFNQAKAVFIQKYPKLVNDWINANPTWKEALTAKPVPVDKVAAGISFDWLATHVTEPKGKHAKILSRGFHKQVDSLSDKLFSEIATEAEDILDKSFLGKDKVSQTVITRLSQVEDKLKDLCFLNNAATPIAQLIDYIRSLMPPNGFIEGECFSVLYSTFDLLRNTEKLMEFADKIHGGMTLEQGANRYLLKSSLPQSNNVLVQNAFDLSVDPPPETGEEKIVEEKTVEPVAPSVPVSETIVTSVAEPSAEIIVVPDQIPTAVVAPFVLTPVVQKSVGQPERKQSRIKTALIF